MLKFIDYHRSQQGIARDKSYITVDNKAADVGPLIGEGSYGKIQDCGDFVIKKIDYRRIAELRTQDSSKINEIKEKELAAIKHEAAIFKHRYQFCEVFDYPTDGLAALIMTKIPGKPLYVNRNPVTKHPAIVHPAIQTRQGFLRTFLKMCIETYYLNTHFKTVHGDIKLPNFLIDQKGNVYLCDFGLSRFLEPLEKTSGKRGDTQYLAPELKMSIDANPNQDVYGLGMILLFYDQHVKPEGMKNILSNPLIRSLFKTMTDPDPPKRITLDKVISEGILFYNKEYPEDAFPFTSISDLKPAPALFVPIDLAKAKDIAIYNHLIEQIIESKNAIETLATYKDQFSLIRKVIAGRPSAFETLMTFIELFPTSNRYSLITLLFKEDQFYLKLIGNSKYNFMQFLNVFEKSDQTAVWSLFDGDFLKQIIRNNIKIIEDIISFIIDPSLQMHFLKKINDQHYILQSLNVYAKRSHTIFPLGNVLTKLKSENYNEFFKDFAKEDFLSLFDKAKLTSLFSELNDEQVTKMKALLPHELLADEKLIPIFPAKLSDQNLFNKPSTELSPLQIPLSQTKTNHDVNTHCKLA